MTPFDGVPAVARSAGAGGSTDHVSTQEPIITPPLVTASKRSLPGRPERSFLAFAVTFFVFHQAWVVLATPLAEAVVSVVNPLAVVVASVGVLRAFGTPFHAALAAIAAATVYVHGRGVHMAADSIQRVVDAPIVTFWDERFGHVVGVLGWLGLLAAFCLAERGARRAWRPARPLLVVAGGLLGWTTFTASVEGQTWWLQLAGAVLFAGWAVRARRPLLVTVAAAFAFGALLIGVWAAWHGGVPELSAI
jgi:hypothetical protein